MNTVIFDVDVVDHLHHLFFKIIKLTDKITIEINGDESTEWYRNLNEPKSHYRIDEYTISVKDNKFTGNIHIYFLNQDVIILKCVDNVVIKSYFYDYNGYLQFSIYHQKRKQIVYYPTPLKIVKSKHYFKNNKKIINKYYHDLPYRSLGVKEILKNGKCIFRRAYDKYGELVVKFDRQGIYHTYISFYAGRKEVYTQYKNNMRHGLNKNLTKECLVYKNDRLHKPKKCLIKYHLIVF
jgi:hypothetical protein